MKKFFSWAEEEIIISAIREAERSCDCEIRVHVEFMMPPIPVIEAAIQIFEKLKMHRTARRNGVLIFLVPERNEFAIIGDTGIHEKVPPGYWDEVYHVMKNYFQHSRFVAGTCEAIRMCGDELKKHFYNGANLNQLPDKISYA